MKQGTSPFRYSFRYPPSSPHGIQEDPSKSTEHHISFIVKIPRSTYNIFYIYPGNHKIVFSIFFANIMLR